MVMSRAAASPGSSEISGKPSPFSHLETVRLLTYNWAASCIWVSPSALRWVLMVRPISFASISAVRGLRLPLSFPCLPILL